MAKNIVVGIVIFKGDVLILKRASTRQHSPDLWEFVSGFVKNGESPEKAVLREVKEETKLNGKIIRSGKSFETRDEWGSWLVTPFLIKVETNKIKISREHSEYRWIKPKEIVKFKCVVDIKRDLEAVGLL